MSASFAKIAAVLLAAVSFAAHAEFKLDAEALKGWTVGATLVSKHDRLDSKMNDINPGVYVKSPEGWSGGVYKNSFRRPSPWVGYSFDKGQFSLTVGIIGGYRRRLSIYEAECTVPGYEGKWCTRYDTGVKGYFAPLIAPSVRIPVTGDYAARVTVIPGFGDKVSRTTAVNFGVEHSWK